MEAVRSLSHIPPNGRISACSYRPSRGSVRELPTLTGQQCVGKTMQHAFIDTRVVLGGDARMQQRRRAADYRATTTRPKRLCPLAFSSTMYTPPATRSPRSFLPSQRPALPFLT